MWSASLAVTACRTKPRRRKGRKTATPISDDADARPPFVVRGWQYNSGMYADVRKGHMSLFQSYSSLKNNSSFVWRLTAIPELISSTIVQSIACDVSSRWSVKFRGYYEMMEEKIKRLGQRKITVGVDVTAPPLLRDHNGFFVSSYSPNRSVRPCAEALSSISPS